MACALILVKPKIIFRNAEGVSVKGVATERVLSDIASWSASVQVRDISEGAWQKKIFDALNAAVEKVRAKLLSAGAKNELLNITNSQISPIFKRTKDGNANIVDGYVGNVALLYASNDVALV